MKTFAIALSALTLVAGAAQADSFRQQMDAERRDNGAVSMTAGADSKVRIPAGMILSNRDLVNSYLSADDLVSVTLFPSTGVVDNTK